MPGSIKRKSQRAGGCSWRDQRKKSLRKSRKMRGGGYGHLHKKGGNRKSMRGGGGCGYNPQRGRGRSMRKLSRKRISMKRKRVVIDEESRLRRR
jgi:hypothetical protein